MSVNGIGSVNSYSTQDLNALREKIAKISDTAANEPGFQEDCTKALKVASTRARIAQIKPAEKGDLDNIYIDHLVPPRKFAHFSSKPPVEVKGQKITEVKIGQEMSLRGKNITVTISNGIPVYGGVLREDRPFQVEAHNLPGGERILDISTATSENLVSQIIEVPIQKKPAKKIPQLLVDITNSENHYNNDKNGVKKSTETIKKTLAKVFDLNNYPVSEQQALRKLKGKIVGGYIDDKGKLRTIKFSPDATIADLKLLVGCKQFSKDIKALRISMNMLKTDINKSGINTKIFNNIKGLTKGITILPYYA